MKYRILFIVLMSLILTSCGKASNNIENGDASGKTLGILVN